jgi:hypothetical protein
MKTGTSDLAHYAAKHFLWRVENRVGYLTLNRPEKKNPLTFESYAELRDLFRALHEGAGVRAVVVDGAAVGRVRVAEARLGPLAGFHGEPPVRFVEERPPQACLVHVHQSPSKTGFCFAANAS